MQVLPPVIPDKVKNRRVALAALSVFFAMVGLAYASVPLYRMFCQATGFEGTTQRVTAAPVSTSDKYINVRFDGNVAGSLGWQFQPKERIMRVRLGEPNTAHYMATNIRNAPSAGTATYNVSPGEAGIYFNKIQCFCFTRQELKPLETADLPVEFFVDPAILDDPDTRAITEITLSYSFYPAEKTTAGNEPPQVPLTPVTN